MRIDPADTDWWRRAVFYQVYPRSFQDSNGDGIGDLPGIIDRLDYLAELGIDAVWISPTFPSPMKDFGYDVSDYCGVDPMFGTLADMQLLIAEAHRRDLRVLLDWVPNHSSDLHPWFEESRGSRDNPKRDWFYWRDPQRDGSQPNNWRSVFGGSAWEFEPETGQYYLHSFLKEQPDLNWRNPDVVAAMHETLRFWMRLGIDGFRMDVVHMLLKHPEMPDNPVNPEWKPGDRDADRLLWTYSSNFEHVYTAVEGIRRVLAEFPDRVGVGETSGKSTDFRRYYGEDGTTGLHLAFNFQFISGSYGAYSAWEPARFSEILSHMERSMPVFAQPCYAFGNHDRPRFVSRYNEDGHGQERARAMALLQLALRGSPFIYYGEEIGMEDVPVPEGQLQDPARFLWEGRDPERTPMQWDDSSGRGFTTGEPWLPFGKPEINVAAQSGDPGSLLSLYRRAIAVRAAQPALHSGAFAELQADDAVYAFLRDSGDGRPVFVAINTSGEPRSVPAPWDNGEILVCTDPARDGQRQDREFTLAPFAAAWLAAPMRAPREESIG